MPRWEKTLRQRFDEKYKPDLESGCWIWTGAPMGKGYGHMWKDGRLEPAHRISYELAFGKIPTDLQLDHLCRNTKCVNPQHLEPVTCRDNLLRGIGPSAQHARKENCPRCSEDYSFHFTHGKPSRYCRNCARQQARERYHAAV